MTDELLPRASRREKALNCERRDDGSQVNPTVIFISALLSSEQIQALLRSSRSPMAPTSVQTCVHPRRCHHALFCRSGAAAVSFAC